MAKERDDGWIEGSPTSEGHYWITAKPGGLVTRAYVGVSGTLYDTVTQITAREVGAAKVAFHIPMPAPPPPKPDPEPPTWIKGPPKSYGLFQVLDAEGERKVVSFSEVFAYDGGFNEYYWNLHGFTHHSPIVQPVHAGVKS